MGNMMGGAGLSAMRKGGAQGMMSMMAGLQTQQAQLMQQLTLNVEALLLKWNQQMLQRNGLQCTSAMPSVGMTNANQIGVIVKRFQTQTGVVVQQQAHQAATAATAGVAQGQEGDGAPPAYDEADAPPPYTNQ